MLDVFKFPGCINSSCWYTVSLKVVILATGTFDIFRISVKYILIQTRRISYSAFYKKLGWVIICSFQKVRLPYTTLGMLVSPQDTAVPRQSDHNLAGTLWLPSTKKNLIIDLNTTTVLYPGYMGKKCQEGSGCWARWPPPVPSNLVIVWHEKFRYSY